MKLLNYKYEPAILPPRSEKMRSTRKGRIIEAEPLVLGRIAGGVAISRRFVVSTPSANLRGHCEVYFEADTGPGMGFDVAAFGSTWTLRKLSRGTRGLCFGGAIPGMTDVQLPNDYEWDSAVKDFLATCTLDSSAFVDGTWFARARWEPTDAGISESEIENIAAACAISGFTVG